MEKSEMIVAISDMACRIYCTAADSNTTIVRTKDIEDAVDAATRIFNLTTDVVYGHK